MADNTVFTKKQVAEYNTSQDSLRQLATMEWNIDEMFRAVYAGGIDSSDSIGIKTLYHYLTFVYADRLWAFAWTILQENDDPKKATFSKFEKELTELYNDWNTAQNRNKVPKDLIIKLRQYKRWLYEVKQKQIKLGVPTRVETTANERMEKAAGV
jgi:hypothetical protein